MPKQDDRKLRDLRDYVNELLDYRHESISKDELPDDAEPVDESGDDDEKGTVVKKMVTCGKQSCPCMNGGEKHGPYLYRYYRDSGSVKCEYVGKP